MSSELQRLETRINELEARIDELEQQTELTPINGPVDVPDAILRLNDDRPQPSLRQVVRDEISHFERAYGKAAPLDYVVEEVAAQEAADTGDVLEVIDQLRREGSIYEPTEGHVRVV